MYGAALTGLLAALLVFLPRYFDARFSGFSWSSPVYLLGIGALAMVFQKFILNRRPGNPNYDGLADLFIHIHTPYAMDSPLRWFLRGVSSFLLALFGGTVGYEGSAIELLQSLRMKLRAPSGQWFEQLRRTDAAMSLSAGIAAAFAAPFTGVLLPIELGVGGKSIDTAASALFAFLGIQFLSRTFSIQTFDVSGVLAGLSLLDYKQWVGFILLGVLGGILGVITIHFIRFTQEGLLNLFQTQAWMRFLAGAILLSMVFFIYRPAHIPSGIIFEEVLWMKHGISEVLVIFLTQWVALALVLSGFGTTGVFAPLFALGGLAGFFSNQALWGGLPEFSSSAGLIGAVALWGAVLGIPLTGAVLAFELTQNLQIFIPCLVAGLIARKVCRSLKTQSLVHHDLEARGVSIIDGRSSTVLNSIPVREAMITDFEIVHEQEPISELHARTLKARYPFMPVVNAQGFYLGLLTVDMIQDAWLSQAQTARPLSQLLEAKDILYRSGFKPPIVKMNDRLSDSLGIFDKIPCVPVLGEDRRVAGLLFVYSVRLAYDREVARRSFTSMRENR